MNQDPTIVCFRRDLRLADHPALHAAVANGGPVFPVFVVPSNDDPSNDEMTALTGSAGRWWLHHSLTALDAELRRLGSRLIIRRGPFLAAIRQLVHETGAAAVYWNRCYEPSIVTADETAAAQLIADGVRVKTFAGALLLEPSGFLNRSGKPYQVFTPFYKAGVATLDPGKALPAPDQLPALPGRLKSCILAEFELLPREDWAGGFQSMWTPGAIGAAALLERFDFAMAAAYAHDRDFPDSDATSRLSPHLHFGEISPRQVWTTLASRAGRSSTRRQAVEPFCRQLFWREFAAHLLYHFPHTPNEPLRTDFADFPWEPDERLTAAWRRGATGYPIVDAGMRQLWHTGWMHNRVRMIVASFLTKHLLISWQEGAAWFWDTLVDADLANNTLGWQWTAGCGADAAPYFRVFNPILQGQRFDAAGRYVRRWVPELAHLPDRVIHAPWTADPAQRAAAGLELGRDYPEPVVAHADARKRALAAYEQIRKRKVTG